MLLCYAYLLFYVCDRLIYDIFDFGIWVPNILAQKVETKKHVSPPSTSRLTKSVLNNCLILSNSRYMPIFMLGRCGRLTPWGGARRFFATFREIVHLI